MGGALGVPEEHNPYIVPNHRQQWSSFWGKALDNHTTTSVRASSFQHGNKCSYQGFNW